MGAYGGKAPKAGSLTLLAGEGTGLAAIFAGTRIVTEVVFIHPDHVAFAMGPCLGLGRVTGRTCRLSRLLVAGLRLFPGFRRGSWL